MMRGLFTATTKKEIFMEKKNSFYRSGVSLTLNEVVFPLSFPRVSGGAQRSGICCCRCSGCCFI